MEEQFKFCIDSSTLIDIGKIYPKELVPQIWKILEKLYEEGRLIAPKEVFFELQKIDDEISKWARDHEDIFVEVDEEQIKNLRLIYQSCPAFAEPERMPPHADPWIITLAMKENETYKRGESKFPCAVVTAERLKPNCLKIPNVCQTFGIKCFSLFDFWKLENK